MMKNKKGFTLIELLLVLGLLGIISTVIFSVFITNIKNFERIGKKIEVQENMRTAIEFISRQAMTSIGILEIKDQNDLIRLDKLNNYKNTKIQMEHILFLTKIENNNGYEYNRKLFNFKRNILMYGHIRKNILQITEKSANMEVAWYINKINIELIFNENSLIGMTFTVHTDKEYDIKPITTTVYFRNKEV